MDFSEVKEGTYVTINGEECTSINIDGVKAWEYVNPIKPYWYTGNQTIPSDAHITMTYVTSTAFEERTLDNIGEVESYVKAGGSYAYPIGTNKLYLRDGEYLLTMQISFNDISQGAMSTNVFPVKFKFQRSYKKAQVWAYNWFSTWSGLDELIMTITVGDRSVRIDLSEEFDEGYEFEPTNEFDEITFSFNFTNSSYSVNRILDNMGIVIDSIVCYA